MQTNMHKTNIQSFGELQKTRKRVEVWRHEMNVLLIPMMLMTTLTQIQVSPELIVQGTAIKHNNEDYVGLPGDKWILIKGIVESADNDCKDIINDAVHLCQHQLEGCHETCNNIPEHQRNLIKVLTMKVENQDNQIKTLQKRSDFWKYAAIIGSSVALSAGTYILIK